jgi:hypothetical protein
VRLTSAMGAAVAVVIVIAIGTALIIDTGADPTVRTPSTGSKAKPFVDKRNGMSVRIPPGWQRIVPPPTAGVQRLTVQSSAQTTRCDGSTTPSAQVAVIEVPPDLTVTPAPIRRPAEFGAESGQRQEGVQGEGGCFANTGVAPGQAIVFFDEDRTFQVFVTLYPGADAEQRQRQAYEILNSLRFTPNDELRRPVVTLPGQAGSAIGLPRVLVLNGSGTPDVATATASLLRGRGYAIAGVANGSARTGNLVRCRAMFEDQASELAKALQPIARVSTFPRQEPTGAENTDCIVTVGG